jgi:hypothetical protein
MNTTKFLSAAAVAIFMMGVVAGYTLSGAEPAPEAARFKVKSAMTHVGVQDQTPQLPMIIALDVLARETTWAPRTLNGSN